MRSIPAAVRGVTSRVAWAAARRALPLGAALALAGAAFAQGSSTAASPGSATTIRPLLWQSGMKRSDVGEVNVFRRFSSDKTAKMLEFYGEVLELPVLPSSAIGGSQMIRYPLGRSEVKLFPVMPAEPNRLRIDAAVGMRLLTFFFRDRDALTERFKYHGYKAPAFRADDSRAGASAAALVQDADGEWVELVIVPDAPEELLTRFEIGMTVANLDASRAFYRDLMGLDEQAPVRDEVVGATRHPFSHGTTTISLWSFGRSLPSEAQTAGMQYIVWDVVAVEAVVQARRATIDRALSNPGQMRTLWLLDPDGVSNYFAEYAGNDNTPPGTQPSTPRASR